MKAVAPPTEQELSVSNGTFSNNNDVTSSHKQKAVLETNRLHCRNTIKKREKQYRYQKKKQSIEFLINFWICFRALSSHSFHQGAEERPLLRAPIQMSAFSMWMKIHLWLIFMEEFQNLDFMSWSHSTSSPIVLVSSFIV